MVRTHEYSIIVFMRKSCKKHEGNLNLIKKDNLGIYRLHYI